MTLKDLLLRRGQVGTVHINEKLAMLFKAIETATPAFVPVTFYVHETNGNDANDGRTEDTPVKTAPRLMELAHSVNLLGQKLTLHFLSALTFTGSEFGDRAREILNPTGPNEWVGDANIFFDNDDGISFTTNGYQGFNADASQGDAQAEFAWDTSLVVLWGLDGNTALIESWSGLGFFLGDFADILFSVQEGTVTWYQAYGTGRVQAMGPTVFVAGTYILSGEDPTPISLYGQGSYIGVQLQDDITLVRPLITAVGAGLHTVNLDKYGHKIINATPVPFYENRTTQGGGLSLAPGWLTSQVPDGPAYPFGLEQYRNNVANGFFVNGVGDWNYVDATDPQGNRAVTPGTPTSYTFVLPRTYGITAVRLLARIASAFTFTGGASLTSITAGLFKASDLTPVSVISFANGNVQGNLDYLLAGADPCVLAIKFTMNVGNVGQLTGGAINLNWEPIAG